MATAFAPTRVWQGLVSGKIPLGRALESDLSAEPTVETAVWEQASEEHNAFWSTWAPWRHASPGTLGGSFHDIVRMFRMEEQLVAHMNIGSGTTVIECCICLKIMKSILFLWPPKGFLSESLFKHFTFFGETIGYISQLPDLKVSAIDAAVLRYTRSELISAFRANDILAIFIEHYNVESALAMIELAKGCNPSLKIVAFGTACCYYPKFILESSPADAAINNGEWELGIRDFVEFTLGKRKIEDVNKMLLRYGNRIVETKKFKKLPGDQWAYPAFDLLPLDEYLKLNKSQMEILVSRGCPYNCLFCAEKVVYGSDLRTRDVNSVVDYTTKYRNTASIFYLDATTFTYDRNWVLALCNKLINSGHKIPWRSDTRVDKLDEELIKKMAEAGCKKLSLGIETLNPEVQQYIRKPIKKEKIKEVFNLLLKHKITPRSLLILGLPGQTKEDILSTVRLLKEWGSEVRLKEYYPYHELLKEDLTLEDIRKFDRTKYCHHKIEGLSCSEYLQLLFPEN